MDTSDTTPADTSPDEPLRPRDATPLEAGVYRTDEPVGPLLQFDFELSVDGLYTLVEEAALFVNRDEAGVESIVMIFHVDNGSVALSPDLDLGLLNDPEIREASLSKPPADLLDWLGDRVGIDAGPIEDSSFGGVPSRRRSITFTDFPGGRPCFPDDERPCHILIGANPTGSMIVFPVGDGATAHEFTVGGHRLVAFVDETIDPTLAAQIAESFRIEVVPPPGAAPGSEPLPFAGDHVAGARYYSERSTAGLWSFDGVAGLSTRTGYLRDRFVFIRAGEDDCMSITDSTQGNWFGVALELDPDPLGDVMPTDIAEALAAAADLEIVAGPSPVTLGDAAGVAVDVRPIGNGDVVLANTTLRAEAGAVTRVIAVERSDGEQPDLVVVRLGSACEAVIDGLELSPSGRP
ncbi:MAG: hypothetical protein NTZ21_11130 [Actinobacteria bacterium]|nr:hypothetical protein [Actinomycetota bacterium]